MKQQMLFGKKEKQSRQEAEGSQEDPNEISQPIKSILPFNVWFEQNREILSSQNPELSSLELTKLAMRSYKDLPQLEKVVCFSMSTVSIFLHQPYFLMKLPLIFEFSKMLMLGLLVVQYPMGVGHHMAV